MKAARWLFAGTMLGSAAIAAPSLAQTSPPAGLPAESPGAAPLPSGPAPAPPVAVPPVTAPENSVSEVVVTAERREQKLESVPVAVTAFTADQRQLVGISTFQDLTNYSPGLAFNTITNRAILRGVGRNTDNLAVASAVAIYVNDVSLGANATTILQQDDLFIDQVEVNRGPQNTLHGSNSDGGTIDFHNRRPTKDYFAEGRVGYSNYDRKFAEALVSGPISDRLRFQIGANYTDQDGGYYTNIYDGHKDGGGVAQGGNGNSHYFEAQLEANLSEKLDAWAIVSSTGFRTSYHQNETIGNIPNYEFLNGAFSPSGFYALCSLPGQSGAAGCSPAITGQTVVPGSVVSTGVLASQFPGNNPGNVNQRAFINEVNNSNKFENNIALQTKWNYHLPAADITYTGGYQSFDYYLDYESNATSGVRSFQLQGPARASPTCLLVFGASAGCAGNLTVNPAPSQTLFIEKENFWSHELDLTSTWDGPFQYIAGLYWYHEHYNQPVSAGVQPNQSQFANPYYLGPLAGVNGLCPAGALLCKAPVNNYSAVSTSITNLRYDSYAAYFQGDYKFSDQWKLTAGVRYTDDRKDGQQYWRFETFDQTSIFTVNTFGAATPALDLTAQAIGAPLTTGYRGAGVTVYDPRTGLYQRQLDQTWSAVTGNVDLNWTPDPTTLIYAKYTRGYKTGGFSTFTIAANPETEPEHVDAVEVGLKKTIGRRLTFNAEGFHYDYQNDQIPLAVQNASGLIATQLFNLPDVETWGVELETSWTPIEALTINLQYSHLDATVQNGGGCFEDTVDPFAQQPGANRNGCPVAAAGQPQTQNLKGQTIPESAPNKISLNGLYRWRFEPGDLILSGTFIWKDATYDGIFNRPYDLAPSYTQVDTRLTWRDKSNRYTVLVYCNNLFNKTGYDGVAGSLLSPAGQPQQIVSSYGLTPPRTYGVELHYRFR